MQHKLLNVPSYIINMKTYVGFAGSDDDETEEQSENILRNIQLTETKGDIFDAPDGTVLCHACNHMGNWNAGIALEFRRRYPKAFTLYRIKCKTDSLLGKCLLIPPCEDDGPKHYVACLFTSFKYGRSRDSKESILSNTKYAIENMISQIETTFNDITDIRLPKINSVNFKVPWNETANVLRSIKSEKQWILSVVDLK